MNISDYLFTGEKNARNGRELCALLRITQRELTQAVNRERRAGKPICASMDASNPGYYLAANKSEMQRYCNSLYRRAGEIHKTRKACIKTIDSLPESKGI